MERPDRNSQNTPARDGLRHFRLEELFHGKSPQEWRAAYADAFDCGPDVGREIVDE